MAEVMWNSTIIAEAKLGEMPNTPDNTNNPDASAEPTYPGAAGIK